MTLTAPAALELWRRVLAATLRRDGGDLTGRQMALLLAVYTTAGPHTVRGLAATLGISKAAVTRGLDRLGELDLARRKRDDADRRNVLVQRTVKGSVYLSEFAGLVAAAAEQPAPPAGANRP